MHICIYGEYTGRSLGDHLILHGILRAVADCDPNARVTVICGSNRAIEDTLDFAARCFGVAADLYTVCALPVNRWLVYGSALTARLRARGPLYRTTFPGQHLRYRAVRRLLEDDRPDLLLLGGGQMLMDLYPVGLVEPLDVVRMFRHAGVPVKAFGIGAGPLNTAAGRDDAREIADLAAFIGVRDDESAALLHKCGADADIHNVGDAAFLAVGTDAPPGVPANAGGCPRLGISVAPFNMAPYWPGGDDAVFRRYIESWVQFLQDTHSRIGATHFVGLTTNIPHDRIALEAVAAALPGEIVLDIPPQAGLEDIIDAVTGVDIVIGSRMHACMAAFVSGRPALGIAYQPKVAALFRECGVSDQCADLNANGGFESGPLLDRLSRLIEDMSGREACQRKVNRRAGEGREAFKTMWQA